MTMLEEAVPQRRYDDGSGTAQTVRQMVLDHDKKIDDLMGWRSELRGAFRLMTLVMGTSLLALIVSIITIVMTITEKVPK